MVTGFAEFSMAVSLSSYLSKARSTESIFRGFVLPLLLLLGFVLVFSRFVFLCLSFLVSFSGVCSLLCFVLLPTFRLVRLLRSLLGFLTFSCLDFSCRCSLSSFSALCVLVSVVFFVG